MAGQSINKETNTNLILIFSITLMSVLGIASVNPVLPKISAALEVNPDKIGLITAVFALPGIVLTPVLGFLADRHGRKRVLVPALLLFGIAGTACVFARDFNLLLILRFFQGAGAASLGALNVTLIGDLFSKERQGAAMGYNNSILSLGTATFPILGGALAELDWYYTFLLPVMALPIAFIILFKLKNPEPDKSTGLGEYFRNLFYGIRQKRILVLFSLSLFTFVVLFGVFLTYFPFLLDSRFDVEPFVIGLLLSSMSLFQSLTAAQLGRLQKKFRKKILLSASFSLYSIALVLMLLMPEMWLLFIPTAVFGIAQGINVPNVQSYLAAWAPLGHRAAYMSINRMISQVGQALGPVLMGIVFALVALPGVFIAGAIIMLTMTLIIIFVFSSQK